MQQSSQARDEDTEAVDRMLRLGASALTNHELAQLMFGRGLPEGLVDSGLHALACIEPGELAEDLRIGRQGAARFHAALEFCRRLSSQRDPRPRLTNCEVLYSHLRAHSFTSAREQLRVLCLNVRHALLHEFVAAEGAWDNLSVDPRTVFRPALVHKATGLVLAHNHPSGNPEPSVHDIRLTHQLVEGARLLGLTVVDHIVVTPTGYISLRARGYFHENALPRAVLACHDAIDRDPPR